MMTRTAKIVLGVVGGFAVLVIVIIAAGAYMVMSAFQSQETTQQEAMAAFTEMRAKFPGVTPAFTFGAGEPDIARQPPASMPAKPPTMVHVLVFDRTEGRLTRVHLPLSLLKLGNSPVNLDGVKLNMADIERYGSTVLLDGDTPEGDPVFVWTD
jgi:hypothetical protein